MNRWLVLDFETASACDLKACGAYRYAEDPTTEVITLCFESDRGQRDFWRPGEPHHPGLLKAIRQGWTVVCHNAGFERNIWAQIMVAEHGWPEIPLTQWHDTMARACQVALPASLERLLPALKMPMAKDKEGNRLTMSLSRPNKHGGYPERTPELLARVDEYCASDIDGQVAIHRRLGWLPPHERAIFELSQTINDRGIRLDMGYVAACQAVVDAVSGPLAAEFREITGGLGFGQIGKIVEWCKAQGADVPNLQAATLAKLLHRNDEIDEDPEEPEGESDSVVHDLPPAVHRALTIRYLIGSASIKKLHAMRHCVGLDGRARGLLRYHGTTPGRQTGQLLQPHNFPRGTLKVEPDALVDAIMSRDPEWIEAVAGPPIEAVVSGLRHAIITDPGHCLMAGDYSGIQARTVLAVAGQFDKVDLMANDVDVYIDMGCDIHPHLPRPDWAAGRAVFKPQVDAFKKAYPEERQDGKNSVLGCGFQMGDKKFWSKYCPHQPLEFATRIVQTYRKDWAPEVPKLWRDLQDAACETVWSKRKHEASGITYRIEDEWLTAHVDGMPDDCKLWYFNPQPVTRKMPWSTDEEPDYRKGWTYQVWKMGHFVTRDAFGGQLTENVIMKIEREIMEGAKARLEAAGYRPVLDVHDEIVCEPAGGRARLEEFEEIMNDVQPWVYDLKIPVAVEAWTGERYRK